MSCLSAIPFNKQQIWGCIVANQVETFERYDQAYWTYTNALDDTRLPAFIRALTDQKPVSFKGQIFFIKRILMLETHTIIVLKVVHFENKTKSVDVVKE